MNQNQSQKNLDIKIITLGDSHVGKSSLIIRYIDSKFSPVYMTTMGFGIKKKKLKLNDGTEAKLIIFDTAGQERFKSLAQSYVKKADGILMVYDISERETFQSVESWMESAEYMNDNLPIILIGNKSDLNDDRQVSYEEGKKKAEEYECPFYETSCKTGDNVDKCFIELAELVYGKTGKKTSKKSGQKLKTTNSKSKKKGCC